MPSLKARIALTVPDKLRAVLQAFADESGKPVASVIVELLQEMQPQLEALTKIQRQVKAGRTEAAKTTLRHLVGDAAAQIVAGAQPELFKRRRR